MSAKTLLGFQRSTAESLDKKLTPREREGLPMVGEYKVDYSEPTQADVDAANASCANIFENGKWISVNRKS